MLVYLSFSYPNTLRTCCMPYTKTQVNSDIILFDLKAAREACMNSMDFVLYILCRYGVNLQPCPIKNEMTN